MQNVRNAKSASICRCCLSDVLHISICNTIWTSVGEGRCVFKTDEVGQAGRGKKSFFSRTSLMNNPKHKSAEYLSHYLLTYLLINSEIWIIWYVLCSGCYVLHQSARQDRQRQVCVCLCSHTCRRTEWADCRLPYTSLSSGWWQVFFSFSLTILE